MEQYTPMPSIYYEDFIASNQKERADNVLKGDNKYEHFEIIRNNIKEFREKENLKQIVVLWTANTERFCKIQEGVHDTE